MGDDGDHVVQAVLANIINKERGKLQRPSAPALAITGGEEVKPTQLVVYGSTGKRLNFSPEELQQPPDSFIGNAKLEKEWQKVIPVYLRKAQQQTHFQNMSLTQLRSAMERSALTSIQRRTKDQQRKRANKKRKSEVILIRNMVGRGQVDASLREELVSAATQYGTVRKAAAFEVQDSNIPDSEAVRLFVWFDTEAAAEEAQRALHLRPFDGRYIAACFYPLNRFLEKDLAPGPGEPKLPPKCTEESFTEADAARIAEARKRQLEEQVAHEKDLPIPEKMLPPYTQGLIEAIQAAARGDEVSEEMIERADPIAKMRRLTEKSVLEAAEKAEAEKRLLAKKKLETALKYAASLEHTIQEETKKRKLEPAVTTDIEGID
eukprot:TRINITY_DN11717_c1_g1_i1.p1 TRINITY_DN11717_c1_g1~~TRINITY_DN11717_c1_g1_i1.p1  ORF type:complete len:377 (+),score=84.96 TRINITY_DN11717_c1_g1_i1:265-1395(+)